MLGVMGSRFLPLGVVALLLGACAPPEPETVPHYDVEVVRVHPFDESSFTQGLEIDRDGTLLVGTGGVGESRIYRTTLDGEELAEASLDPEFFGEGITRVDGHIWQLTWQDGIAVRRDAATLDEVGRVSYPGEGWGLCARTDELIMSDGTDQLRRLDPHTFEERGRVAVTLADRPAERLNELECVGDKIYANVFLSTDILRIDAASGDVTGIIDASTLPNNAVPHPDHVLNGIAQLPGTDRLLLGGKRWPDLYEVEVVPAQ